MMTTFKYNFTPILLASVLICENVERQEDTSNDTPESSFENEAVFGPMTDTLFDQLVRLPER